MRNVREDVQERPDDAVFRIGTALTSSIVAGAALGAVKATWSVSQEKERKGFPLLLLLLLLLKAFGLAVSLVDFETETNQKLTSSLHLFLSSSHFCLFACKNQTNRILKSQRLGAALPHCYKLLKSWVTMPQLSDPLGLPLLPET